jgi:hypothetical protein
MLLQRFADKTQHIIRFYGKSVAFGCKENPLFFELGFFLKREAST